MDRGRDFSGKVAEIIRDCHRGAAEAPAADRQDAVAVALQTDGPAAAGCRNKIVENNPCDVTGTDDLRPPPIVRTRRAPPPAPIFTAPPLPSLPSLSLVECVAIWLNEARVRRYLASEVAAYLGLAFEDVAPILEALPAQDQWAFESPAGWTEILIHVSERLLGKRPDSLHGPHIH